MSRDLTSGSVLKSVVFFSLPYLLAYFLQTLYGMADLFIIGQFGTVAEVTAVANGSQVMHMLTVIIVGLAMGATVTIGRCVGARNFPKAARAIGNTATLFVALSLVLAGVLLLNNRHIVALIATPTEAVEGTVDYLKICFIGVPFITAYNILSAVFRGMGDSKSPMYFIAVACAVNVGLDYLFMGAWAMGPLGAALGTTLAQTVSVILALAVIVKRKIEIKISAADFKPQKKTMTEILHIGVPVALQDGFIQVSFIIITIIANLRGLDDAAAVGVVEKIIGIFFLVPSSMSQAVSALAAQNIGAREYGRAKKVLYYALIFAAGFGIIASALTHFGAEDLVRLFENDANVVFLGGQYLRSYVWDCVLAAVHFCFSGYFCALGKSGISFLHNFLSIVLVRVPGAYLASAMYADTLFPMGLAAPAGSLLSAVICLIAYAVLYHKEKERLLNGKAFANR